MQASYDVFVSYSVSDAEAVQAVVANLRQVDPGLRIFIDQAIPVGTQWVPALESALLDSRSVAVFFGPQGLESWQNQELNAALSHSMLVIPVLLPGAEPHRMPRVLQKRRWVDLRHGLNDPQALTALLGPVRDTTPPAVQDPEAPSPAVDPFDRLSPLARSALGRAEGFRGRRRAGKIHMEHLLAGLFDEGQPPVPEVFRRAGIDRRGLIGILKRAKLDHPPGMPLEPIPLHSLPPLSNHSRHALDAAARAADAAGSAMIDSRHLLTGWLSITECKVVSALVDAGIEATGLVPEAPAPSALPEVSISPASTGDQPVEVDRLGFEPYVEAIAGFLSNEDTRPPLTLSIEGDWGSGKSSFMLQLESALRHRTPQLRTWWMSLPQRLGEAWAGPRPGRWSRLRRELRSPCFLSVRFNAWRHDQEDAVWAAFASEFLRRIMRQRNPLRRWYGHLRLFGTRYRWRNGWLEMVRAVAVWSAFLAVAVAIPVAVYLGDWTTEIATWLEEIGNEEIRAGEEVGDGEEAGRGESFLKALAATGGLGAYLAGLLSIGMMVKEKLGNPLVVDLRKYLQAPDYDGHVTFVESFHEDFRRIVDAFAGDRTVYIFIDDLDRCEVPKAADLMQAFNLLISGDPRLIFVIGMDREKVAAGLAVKHESLLPYLMPEATDSSGKVDPRRGLDYGFSFIEKFVQLPFRIPSPQPANLREYLSVLSDGYRTTPRALPQADPLLLEIEDLPDADLSVAAGDSSGGEASEASRDEAVTERRERLRLVLRTDSVDVQRAALMVAPALDNNPRRLKQFVNLFRLKAYIAAETGAFDELGGSVLTLPQLAKFVAISLAWPGLIGELAADPMLIGELQEAAMNGKSRTERWFDQPSLARLLRYGCIEERGFTEPPDPGVYGLAAADLNRLLLVSPRILRPGSMGDPPDRWRGL